MVFKLYENLQNSLGKVMFPEINQLSIQTITLRNKIKNFMILFSALKIYAFSPTHPLSKFYSTTRKNTFFAERPFPDTYGDLMGFNNISVLQRAEIKTCLIISAERKAQ
jgi:hypothetical protein